MTMNQFKLYFLFFRERYLHFLCSLELREDISMTTIYNLCRVNLGKAGMLSYVHVLNISDWEAELDFVFGQKDKEQWKVR